jgi:hypothetical protein
MTPSGKNMHIIIGGPQAWLPRPRIVRGAACTTTIVTFCLMGMVGSFTAASGRAKAMTLAQAIASLPAILVPPRRRSSSSS